MPAAENLHRKRHMQCSKKTLLFDHLVGALLEKPGHIEAERLRGLEVDNELEFSRQLPTGRFAGLAPLRMRST